MARTCCKLLFFLMIFPWFFACSSSVGVDNQTTTPEIAITYTTTVQEVSTPQSTNSQTSAEIKLNRIEVSFWHPWSNKTEIAVTQLIENFNETNQWGIKIIDENFSDEKFLANRFVESENLNPPDFLVASSSFLYNQHINSKNLIDLSTFMNHEEWGFTEGDLLSIPLVFLNQDISDNFRYGIPVNRTAFMLFYNQEWASELGFEEPPGTPEEFINQACAAARENALDANPLNNGTGGWLYSTDPLSVLSWMRAFGGGELPINDTEGYFFLDDNNKAAFEMLHDIFHIDCAWTGKEDDTDQYFAERKAIFFSGDLTNILAVYDAFSLERNTDTWKIIPYPSEGGEPILFINGLSFGILSEEPDKQLAAWLFIRFMLEPENQARLTEANGSIPITTRAFDFLGDFKEKYPMWSEILTYLPLAKAAPKISTWPVAGSVLSDAAWQLMQFTMKIDEIPALLEMAETTTREILNAQK